MGRALGVDAAELAEKIDLAGGVIRALYESSRVLTELDALAENHDAAVIDDALQTLPRLS